MNKKQKREIVQLSLAAKHFFNISKKRFNKLSPASQKIRMKDLAKKFENFTWSAEDKGLNFNLLFKFLRHSYFNNL